MSGLPNLSLLKPSIAFIMLSAASTPCTETGHISKGIGKRSFTLLIMSCTTEPVGDVIIPNLSGKKGNGIFLSSSK